MSDEFSIDDYRVITVGDPKTKSFNLLVPRFSLSMEQVRDSTAFEPSLFNTLVIGNRDAASDYFADHPTACLIPHSIGGSEYAFSLEATLRIVHHFVTEKNGSGTVVYPAACGIQHARTMDDIRATKGGRTKPRSKQVAQQAQTKPFYQWLDDIIYKGVANSKVAKGKPLPYNLFPRTPKAARDLELVRSVGDAAFRSLGIATMLRR